MSTFSSSPEERAGDKVSTQGREQLEAAFAKGIAVTVDLCSAHVRTGFGHPEAGEMLGPRGTIRTETAILHPGELLMHGPVLLPEEGIAIEVSGGGEVTSALVCADQATRLAKAFLEGAPGPGVPMVASVQVRDRAVLDAGDGSSCKLIHVLRSAAATRGEVRVRYQVNELSANLPPLATCPDPADPDPAAAGRRDARR